jgi:hypothetical protein
VLAHVATNGTGVDVITAANIAADEKGDRLASVEVGALGVKRLRRHKTCGQTSGGAKRSECSI